MPNEKDTNHVVMKDFEVGDSVRLIPGAGEELYQMRWCSEAEASEVDGLTGSVTSIVSSKEESMPVITVELPALGEFEVPAHLVKKV